jgi:hypothetical protein
MIHDIQLQVHRIDNQIFADAGAKLDRHNYASSNSLTLKNKKNLTLHFIGDLLKAKIS